MERTAEILAPAGRSRSERARAGRNEAATRHASRVHLDLERTVRRKAVTALAWEPPVPDREVDLTWRVDATLWFPTARHHVWALAPRVRGGDNSSSRRPLTLGATS